MNALRFFRYFIFLICCYALMGATLPDATAFPFPSVLIRVIGLTVALIVFLVLSAFYSGSETALVSLNKVKIDQFAENGQKTAQIVKDLVETPDKMLGMTLVGTNLANVVTYQVGLALVVALVTTSARTQEQIATVMTTVLVLIFGELLPKTIFRAQADTLALRYAYPLRISELALGLIVNAVTYLTRLLVTDNAQKVSPDVRRDELRLLATMGEQSGGILRDQRRMIHSVLDLQTRTVEQVMVPLVDIVAVEKEADIETFLQIASDSGFSRIPVYQQRIYNIVGVVHLLDVIYANGDSPTIKPFIRAHPYFVPESKRIGVLLKEIQLSHHTMAFVVDEYGGIVGLVTVEDLVEEIVGEVVDERDGIPDIRVIGPRILECEGRTEIDTIRDRFGVEIPSGPYETIAGYILEQKGTIPKPGDEIQTDTLIITISAADARTIKKVRLRNKVGHFIIHET